jgi:WD40 repeat protein
LGVVDASGIWLYDLANLDTPPELLYMPNQQVNDVTFNTDATLLAVGTGGFMPSETDIKAVWIWDVATHTLQTRLDQEFRVDAVAFSPDGQFLAVSQSSKLFLWHLPNSYEYGVLSLDGATDLIFNPDSRHLIVNYRDFYGEIWDITRGTVSESMYDSIGGGGDSPGDSMFYTPTLNPDGLTLATETLDGIILWNGVTGIRQQEIYKITDTSTRAPIRISDMAFSPDNHWLATSGDQLRLWDMTFNSVTVLQAELATEEQTLSVAFSGNGQYLLASGNERTELWEVNTRKRVATLTGRHGVFGDGDLAITFNSDIVYVWDMDGQLINELHTLTG